MHTIVKQQDEIEVFVNEAGGITISQKHFHGEKHIVTFWRCHADVLVNAIERAAREAELDE